MIRLRQAGRWLFRDRKTGRIVIVQRPNVPLAIFIVCAVLQRVFLHGGRVGDAVGVVGEVGLIVWSVDEIARGVNPWRRLLGGGTLASQVVGLLHR